jgi:hypothetical protein
MAAARKVPPTGNADSGRHWPGYLFGGRVRTSTLALVVVFLLAWWTYDTYRPPPNPPEAPQVVPPGFVPDPNYTWVPRTRLQQPPVTVTETITPTPTTTEPPSPSEPEPPPPLLPCPPFCPPPPESPPPAPPAIRPARRGWR